MTDSLEHIPYLRVLSEAQIERLVQASLECLQRTGVEVRNREAREILGDAGAAVEGTRVRIPAQIVEKALAAVPPTFTIFGRHGRKDMPVEPDRVCFGPGPTCTYFMDPQTGARRKVQKGDPALTARVCDSLDNIDYVMSLGLIDDVTPSLAPVYEFAEMITHSAKPVLAWAYKQDQLEDIYHIALAVSGDEETLRRRPPFAYFSTWQSPMIHPYDNLANCLWAVEKGIPVVYIGGGTLGLSAPITGAGAIVCLLSSLFSGLAILQLKKPGAPVCMGGEPGPMDLRTARPAFGGPEMSLYGAAMADITRYLKIPFMGTAGASESKLVDLQAAIESTIQVLLSIMSRANLVHDVGFLDCADLGSLEMLVMTDEIIAMAKRIQKGVVVNEDTLALDLIDKIGPGGTFINTDETAKKCRAEIFHPGLMDRDEWAIWQENGALTTLDRVKYRLKDILDRQPAYRLSKESLQRISEILQTAEQREGKVKLPEDFKVHQQPHDKEVKHVSVS